MTWEPEYHEIDYSGVVVVGVVNMPAPLVRETVGMLQRVADTENAAELATLLPRYYRLLGLWMREVRDGETVHPLGTAESIQAFEESQDWVILGMALRELIAERERRRAEAARQFREADG